MFGKACALLLAAALAGTAAANSTEWVNDRDAKRVVCYRAQPTGSVIGTAKICRPKGSSEAKVDARRADEGEYRAQLAERWEQGLNFGATTKQDRAIQVGRANWAKLPALKAKPRRLPYTQMVNTVEAMLRSGKCSLAGQSARAFDIEVPVAVYVGPDGKAERVLVGDMDCEPLESLVGVTMLARSDRGDFQPTGGKARWYGTSLNFTLTR